MKKIKKGIVGRTAIVHPEITTDPADRKGQIGIITESDATKGTIQLQFSDGGTGKYESSTVFVLATERTLNDGFLARRAILTNAELMIGMYVIRMAGENNHSTALILAMKYPNIAAFSTVSCVDFLAMDNVIKSNKGIRR